MKHIHPIRKYFLTIWSMIRSNIRDYGMYIAFIVIAIAFSSMTGGLFLQPRNFSNLLDQTAYVAVLAVGMTLVIVTRMIDLSVGYLGAFMGAYVVVAVEVNDQTIGVALLGALGIAILVGIIKGFTVAKLHVPAFVVTLAGMFIFKGLLMLRTNTRTIPTANPFFNRIGIEYLQSRTWGPFDTAVIIFGILAALYLIIRYGKKRSLEPKVKKVRVVKEAVNWQNIARRIGRSLIKGIKNFFLLKWFKYVLRGIKNFFLLKWFKYIIKAIKWILMGIKNFVLLKWIKYTKGFFIFLLRSLVIIAIVAAITLPFAYIVIHPISIANIGIYGLIIELLIIGGVVYYLRKSYVKNSESKDSFGKLVWHNIGIVLAYATIIGGIIIEIRKPKSEVKYKFFDKLLSIVAFIGKIVGSLLIIGVVFGFSVITGWLGKETMAGTMNLLSIEVGVILLVGVIFNFIRNRNKKYKLGLQLENMSVFLTKLFIMIGIVVWLTYTLASFRGISYLLLITIVVVIVYVFMTTQTVIGRRVFAVGGNPEAAELSGISVAKIIIFVMISMGVLAMISGIMYVTRTQNTSPNHGPFWELYAIAAAYIGGTSADGGSGKVVNSVVGAVVIISLKNGMALAGFDSNIEHVVLGGVLLLAVVFDIYTRNVRAIDMVGVYLAKEDNQERLKEAVTNYKNTRKELRVARNQNVENLIDYEYRFMNAEGQLKRIKDMIRGSKEEDFAK